MEVCIASAPRTIDIKGVKYRIKVIADLSEDGISLDGLCDTTKKVISIRKNMNEKDYINTLLHECFHAVLFEIGVHCAQMSEDLEEIIVNNLAGFVAENFKWMK